MRIRKFAGQCLAAEMEMQATGARVPAIPDFSLPSPMNWLRS